MGITIGPAEERKVRMKNRTPSQVSGSYGQDVAGVGATGTWAGEKKAKIQIRSTPGSLSKIVRVDKAAQDDADAIINEDQVEGFNWSADDLRIATDQCVKQLNNRLPDYEDEEFWAIIDEDQLQELNVRLALHRIRALEVPVNVRCHSGFCFFTSVPHIL
jgi:hypothetical protein